MSDEQRRPPVEDLKEGFGFLIRAAKSAVERLPTQRVEDIAQDAVKEAGQVFDKLGTHIDQAIHKASDAIGSSTASPAAPAATRSAPPAPAPTATKAATTPAPPAEPVHYDDAYAPEPPVPPRR
jgi:hypothetical protein